MSEKSPNNNHIFDTLQRQAVSTLETYCASKRAQLEVSYVIDPLSAESSASGLTPATCKVIVRQANGKVYSTVATANNKKDARAKAAFAIVQHLIAYGEDDSTEQSVSSSSSSSSSSASPPPLPLPPSHPSQQNGVVISSTSPDSIFQQPILSAPLFIPAGVFTRDFSASATPLRSQTSSQAVSPSGGLLGSTASVGGSPSTIILLKIAEDFF